jgi:pimeloyl-ACP methyl ester carboxylesterase
MHRDHVLDLHGQRFHYTDWGNAHAPVVLMLHGITGHARTWDDEAAALATRYRVLALDQRGHGDSDPAPDGDYTTASLADDVAAFVDALGIQKFGIVALSLGGRVAIAYTARHPERVSRLVVVDIGPDIADSGRTRIGSAMAATPERFATPRDAFAWVRAGNARSTDRSLGLRIDHGLRPTSDGGFTWKYDRGIREAIRAGRWSDPIDLWSAWSAIACPTLLIRGVESDVLSAETATRMLATCPAASLVEVEDAGHTVPGDQPERFLALVTEFLGREGAPEA